MSLEASEFDHVVVGAGSAGCVLANRLSANRAKKVCLIEGGGSDRSLRGARSRRDSIFVWKPEISTMDTWGLRNPI